MKKFTYELYELSYYEANSIVELKYFQAADGLEITGKVLYEIVDHFVRFCKEYVPEKVIINTCAGSILIPPEMQKWMNNEVYPMIISLGVKKVAYVVSEEAFLTQISMKQTVENEKPFKYQFFSDEISGFTWLKYQ